MDAYREGFNRGSADKLSGRLSNDAVPPKYRANEPDRRAFKKGYKDGYASPTRRGPRTGAERELTTGEALIKQAAIYQINDLIQSGIGGDEFVDRAKPVYDKAAADADDTSAKFGRFDSKYIKAELGEIVYGKALELKASPKKLSSISYMATAAQLAATPKESSPFTMLLRPSAFSIFGKTSTPSTATTSESKAPDVPSTSQITTTQPSTTTETRELTAKQAIAASAAQPSWLSSNWPWVAAGTAVVAGGGYLYYRSRQSV